MGNCLPRKKKRQTLDEMIVSLTETEALRTAHYNSVKDSLDQASAKIREGLVNGADLNEMTLLYASQRLFKTEAEGALRLLITARSHVLTAKSAKTHEAVLLLTHGMNSPHDAMRADRELDQNNKMIDDLTDYSHTITNETGTEVDSVIASAASDAMRATNKEKTKGKEEEEEGYDMSSLPIPPTHKRNTKKVHDNQVYNIL
jgi:hypothetical protein